MSRQKQLGTINILMEKKLKKRLYVHRNNFEEIRLYCGLCDLIIINFDAHFDWPQM